MSNLIKSGFVAFTSNESVVVDANKNRIIQSIDADINKAEQIAHDLSEVSDEEALAAALIHDAELDGLEFEDDVLTFDTGELPNLSSDSEDIKMIANEVVNSAKAEAEEIVNNAHEEAEALRAKAYDEAEQIRNTAQEEGYETGYNEGLAKANEELETKMQSLQEQEQQLIAKSQEDEALLISETEKHMVEILCNMVQSLTGVVVSQHDEVLLYMINKALLDQDNSKKFVIKLSSEDYERVLNHKNEIYGSSNPNINIELFEDAKLDAMQCLIETDNGFVDVSLDVQLENLKTAIRLMIKD